MEGLLTIFMVLLLAALPVTLLVYLANAVIRPTWIDFAETALISALWPLSITYSIVVIALALLVIFTIINIWLYWRARKSGVMRIKSLIRLLTIPFFMTIIFILANFLQMMASC